MNQSSEINRSRAGTNLFSISHLHLNLVERMIKIESLLVSWSSSAKQASKETGGGGELAVIGPVHDTCLYVHLLLGPPRKNVN